MNIIRPAQANHQPRAEFSPSRIKQCSRQQPGTAAPLLAGLLILLCLLGILGVLGQDWNTDLRDQTGWQSVQTQPELSLNGRALMNAC